MRDEVTKLERGYKEKKSLVRVDGSETLHGRDWKRRKQELCARSGGQCEQMVSDTERCRSAAVEAHHVRPRSKGRDDRLANLAHLCHFHHERLDWKKIRLRDLRAEQGKPRKCLIHPKVFFDGYVTGCPLCKLLAENDFKNLMEKGELKNEQNKTHP